MALTPGGKAAGSGSFQTPAKQQAAQAMQSQISPATRYRVRRHRSPCEPTWRCSALGSPGPVGRSAEEGPLVCAVSRVTAEGEEELVVAVSQPQEAGVRAARSAARAGRSKRQRAAAEDVELAFVWIKRRPAQMPFARMGLLLAARR
jgi:hypothetical protein